MGRPTTKRGRELAEKIQHQHSVHHSSESDSGSSLERRHQRPYSRGRKHILHTNEESDASLARSGHHHHRKDSKKDDFDEYLFVISSWLGKGEGTNENMREFVPTDEQGR